MTAETPAETPVETSVSVRIDDSRWPDAAGGPAALRALARRCASAARTAGSEGAAAVPEGPPAPEGAVEISLLFADDAASAALNTAHRGEAGPTNVLSFALWADAPGAARAPDAPAALGDVVLAFETVRREADAAGKSFADHTSHLIVHGVLHLLGHDHIKPADAERMERLETGVLASLGVADPYAPEAAADA